MDIRTLLNREDFTLNSKQRAQITTLIKAQNYSGMINYVLECDREISSGKPPMHSASLAGLLEMARERIAATAPSVGALGDDFKLKAAELCKHAVGVQELPRELQEYFTQLQGDNYPRAAQQIQTQAAAVAEFDEFLLQYLRGFRCALRFCNAENPGGTYNYYLDQEELAADLIDSFDLDPQKLMRQIKSYIEDAVRDDDSGAAPGQITCFSASYLELAQNLLERFSERQPEVAAPLADELETLEINLKSLQEEYTGLETKLQCEQGLGTAFTGEIHQSAQKIQKDLKRALTQATLLLGQLKNPKKASRERL